MPLNWVDIAMLGVVLVSALVGFGRGLAYELLSLAGWFVAYFAARWLTPYVSEYIAVGRPGSALNHVVSFACAFIAVLILWSLAAKLVSSLIAATPLRPVDRVLGAGFGFVRGCVLLLVLATIVFFTPFAHRPEWRQSVGASWLESVLLTLLPMMPADVVLPSRST